MIPPVVFGHAFVFDERLRQEAGGGGGGKIREAEQRQNGNDAARSCGCHRAVIFDVVAMRRRVGGLQEVEGCCCCAVR